MRRSSERRMKTDLEVVATIILVRKLASRGKRKEKAIENERRNLYGEE